MEQDDYFTDVIFKIDRMGIGEVDAIFPGIPGTRDSWTVQVYSHIGQHQHGVIGYWRGYKSMRPATPEEYAALFRELESIGYRLRVVERFTEYHLEQRRQQVQS